jgi:hypothetical protein
VKRLFLSLLLFILPFAAGAACVQAGKTYYFTVQVKDSVGGLSSPSSEVCKAFPASVPGTVTVTIAANGDLNLTFTPDVASRREIG